MSKFETLWDTRSGIAYGIEKELEDWLGCMFKENGKFPESIKLTAKPSRMTRGIQQNKLYWVWCQEIADFENDRNGYGWDKDDAHRFLKSEFFIDIGELEETIRYLTEGLIGPRDFIFVVMGIMESSTTTKSDTKEFSEKLEQIRRYYARRGLILRYPDEPPLYSYDPPPTND